MMEDPAEPISNREILREMMRRSDELSTRLSRMDLETQEYRRRHHEQMDQLNAGLGRISVEMARDSSRSSERLDGHDKDIDALGAEIKGVSTEMKGVRRDAAIVSGGIGVAAFLSQYLPWVKH